MEEISKKPRLIKLERRTESTITESSVSTDSMDNSTVDESVEIENIDSESTSPSCAICHHHFKYSKNLYVHVRRFHSDVPYPGRRIPGHRLLEEVPDLGSSPANLCIICNRIFKHAKNLKSHIRTSHSDETYPISVTTIPSYESPLSNVCCVCEAPHENMTDLHMHIELNHDIYLNFIVKGFDSVEKFECWREKVQQETGKAFVPQQESTDLTDDTKVARLYCHWNSAVQAGSDNIAKTCPALMEVSYVGLKVIVEYQSTHMCDTVGIDQVETQIDFSNSDQPGTMLLMVYPADAQ